MDDRINLFQLDLSPDQEAAVKMLASGCSVRYTSLVLGVNQATISAWIARDPVFQSRLKEKESYNPADELEEIEKLGDLVGE